MLCVALTDSTRSHAVVWVALNLQEQHTALSAVSFLTVSQKEKEEEESKSPGPILIYIHFTAHMSNSRPVGQPRPTPSFYVVYWFGQTQ